MQASYHCLVLFTPLVCFNVTTLSSRQSLLQVLQLYAMFLCFLSSLVFVVSVGCRRLLFESINGSVPVGYNIFEVGNSPAHVVVSSIHNCSVFDLNLFKNPLQFGLLLSFCIKLMLKFYLNVSHKPDILFFFGLKTLRRYLLCRLQRQLVGLQGDF